MSMQLLSLRVILHGGHLAFAVVVFFLIGRTDGIINHGLDAVTVITTTFLLTAAFALIRACVSLRLAPRLPDLYLVSSTVGFGLLLPLIAKDSPTFHGANYQSFCGSMLPIWIFASVRAWQEIKEKSVKA